METETNNEVKKTPETTGEAETAPKTESGGKKKAAGWLSSNKLTVAVVGLAVVVAVSAGAIIDAINRNNEGDGGNGTVVNGMTVDYEMNAKVFLDQNSLQAAMDEAMRNAQQRNVALHYRNDASSRDGQTFECYIANSSGNLYDMFLTICADSEMKDELFLSKLLRPGTGYDSITLNRALEPGNHTVYVAVTLVETAANGAQTIKAQALHTMDFHVTG